MPTVIRETGFEVRIYTLDHPPPHVHVERGGADLKVNLVTAKVVRIVGRISDRDRATGRKAFADIERSLENTAWWEIASLLKIVNDLRGLARLGSVSRTIHQQ